MKVLLFGKNSQVGLSLQKNKSKIINLISRNSSEVDFMNTDDLASCIFDLKPDFIINAAAYTDVENAELNKQQAFSINAYAPEVIAIEAKKINIPFLHISTDYVFDGTGVIPWKPEDKVNPINVYGKSKCDGEKRISKVNGQYCILRTSWVFSEHNKNFLKSVISLANEKNKISIVADQIGGPTSADSIAKACYKVIEAYSNKRFISGIFHFSGFPYVSWADFAKAILLKMNDTTQINNISSSEFEVLATRPKNSRLDCDSFFSTYNVKQSSWENDLVYAIKTLKKMKKDEKK